MRDFRFSWNKH